MEEINFTGNLDRKAAETIFFITEEGKNIVLDGSQRTVKVLILIIILFLF